ncbi:MAG TPA: amidohydrolase family protein [Mucilaginibacter sp.]|nr:amidohydrolase family protein [Mucilaginibacter sp.]
MILNNVGIALTDQKVSIRVKNGQIAQILSGHFHDKTEETDLTFGNAIIFPGLINSHDHLDFNLYPPLGDKIYRNYTEWGSYIHNNYKDKIDAVLQVPEELRIQWGIYKNLLCGVTTVVNHGKRIEASNDLLTVYQDCQSIHSVQFEKNWRFALNNPLKKNIPAVVHCGEGTDTSSLKEIDQLARWNLFKRPLIAVHGVAMNEDQAGAFKALVWCPESNYFLLNKTASVNHLKNHFPILFGTDSTLTGNWNVWEHICLARKTKFLTDNELYNSLTINPASVWKLNAGIIEEDKDADMVIAKEKVGPDNANTFFSIDPQDILAVIHKGRIVLFDEELRPQLTGINTSVYSRINIGNSIKYVKGDLPSLIRKIKQYYPNASFPVN